MEDIVSQYCFTCENHGGFSRKLVGAEKRGQCTTLKIEKISEPVQGHLPGINVIRESGSSTGTLCFRERCSPQQLPAKTSGTHQPKTLDRNGGLVPEC